jgi:hypothetical protein
MPKAKALSDEERSYWRKRVNEQFADSITWVEWLEMGRHRGWLPPIETRIPCTCDAGDDLSKRHADTCESKNECDCRDC